MIPNGRQQSFPRFEGISVKLQKRKLEVNAERRYLLVNEKKMRVGSRGVEREGMSPEQIQQAEDAFRSDPDNAGKENVSDKAYRRFRTRPLLILHFLEGTIRNPDDSEQVFAVPPGTALTAIGLSFPALGGESMRVSYRINLVEIRNLIADDVRDDEEVDDDDQD